MIEHVPRELKTLADILTRWMRGYRNVGGRSQEVPGAVGLSGTQVPVILTATSDVAPFILHHILLEA